MLNWFRKIPHFGYGKCGGAKRDCSISKSRDWMDLAFERHDEDLRKASEEKTETLKELAKIQADRRLAIFLRCGDKKKLKLWGRIYLFCAKLVFRS